MRPRALLYALLALAAPLPALALTGGDGETAGEGLSVSASLDGCGTAGAQIVCKLDASWNALPGAERYTASVTRPDGSVIDAGEVGAGSTSVWVPYVGNGTYTVTVSAYGTPPGADEPEVVARGKAATGAEGSDADRDAVAVVVDGAPREDDAVEEAVEEEQGDADALETPVCAEPAGEAEGAVEDPATTEGEPQPPQEGAQAPTDLGEPDPAASSPACPE